jgi:hypothetical protein
MILIIGNESDYLVQSVFEILSSNNISTYFIPEQSFFQCKFVFYYDNSTVSITIFINNTNIKFSQIDGILLRPLRRWIPPAALKINDLPFVYSETLSAWFSMLSTLSTPLVNRYGIGWWLHDANYEIQLLQNLSSCTSIPVCPSEFFNQNNTLVKPLNLQSIYLIGNKIFYPNNTSKIIVALVEQNYDTIIAWAKKIGIAFCSIDFEKKHNIELRNVNVFPIINHGTDNVRTICKYVSEIFI